jgi:hypothetical protein
VARSIKTFYGCNFVQHTSKFFDCQMIQPKSNILDEGRVYLSEAS